MNKISFSIILIIAYIMYKFISDVRKDNKELKNKTLEQMFNYIIRGLNQYAYKGNGTITKINKRKLSLYQNNSNQIIFFEYGTGILTVTWKIKYFHQEMVYQKNLYKARNASLYWQEKALEIVISEFEEQLNSHIASVNNSDIPKKISSKFGVPKENWEKAKSISEDVYNNNNL